MLPDNPRGRIAVTIEGAYWRTYFLLGMTLDRRSDRRGKISAGYPG